MTWQPIDTAPKDGTYILAFDGEDYITIVSWAQYHINKGKRGCWLDRENDPWILTHWQPLPAPPTEGNPEP